MDKRNLVMFPGTEAVKGGAGSLRARLTDRLGQLSFLQRPIHFLATKKWMILLTFMGFLLGRAMILGELSPFAAAYFAVIAFMRRDVLLPVGIAIVAGSLLTPFPVAWMVPAEILIFYFMMRGLETYDRAELSYAPMMVFVSTFFVNLFAVLVGPSITWYSMMMLTLNAVLSFVLTLVFIQAIPVMTLRKKSYVLRNEEILCLIILLASVMTGAVGWTIQSLSIEHVLSRYLILLFALVGGAPLGASVGVVTGLILSLANISAFSQMSLLAFSGMLAGMLKEGKKPGVSLGMLLGATILSIYFSNPNEVLVSTWETCAAIVFFLLTPKSVMQAIGKYVPGTQDHTRSQHEYAKRVRDLTADRVTQFSRVFRQLSQSFGQTTGSVQPPGKQTEEMNHFMNAVAEGSCATCYKRNQCWDMKFYQTYKYMTDMMTSIEENPELEVKDLPAEWSRICSKKEEVLAILKQQYHLYQHDMQWKRQIYDSRHLVAEQLSGVSQVMEDLAREIKRESQTMHIQEEQIREALQHLGLSIQGIDIISLDSGHVEIEIIHAYTRGYDECRKIIAPLLSDILGEHIAVVEETLTHPRDGLATVRFGSAKTFEVITGVAGAAKGGDILSGDSFSTVELGNGTFAVALSDGMGNGERARLESSSALSILEQLLQSGMDEKLAIKSVNSILMLRSPDEIYATVDMALIDQYTAQTTFMKIGSTPSFIKRGNEVIPVTASNLPIGIIQDIEVDLVSIQLQAGDVLIMMTDGIYDAPGYAVNKELWMKRMIQEVTSSDPQEIADCLLEKVIRYQQNQIHDDMTVVVGRVDHYQPEWSNVHIPGFSRMERPRTVS
ncbi:MULTISPECIES: stage II sporulation protein E [Paenibacillus]|uniref:Stage II sporulation protein E n=1 Tax=Paenibacillus lactis TaxID=228574 RepID=A0ABS4FJX5_9BACL|nr:stage II sporulation protein E [Paenibacillus lactis]MBP1896560.1 stage II sporulation protein E [Paenibacillus lactis]GIO94548.1 stage II sporulation protein E [Paenibacillus lactis]HAF98051.1 stage II sporulation protein E [Paenibacillus lactis]